MIEQVAGRVKNEGSGHTGHVMASILHGAGEGIVLRAALSHYHHGRSSLLLKLKTAHGDREGIVTTISRDRAITLQLSDGKALVVPEQNVHVVEKLQLGDIVTFSYEKNARREVPGNAKIYRVRHDLDWNEVLLSDTKKKEIFLNDKSPMGGFAVHPPGYWSRRNLKLFLENLAKSKNMDPLLASTWYNIPYKTICKFKGGRALLRKFKGYFSAVKHFFPNVVFEKQNWGEVAVRRNLFERYAKQHSFDPLVAENWYIQPRTKILSFKGTRMVISYHKNSVFKALVDLFPNIGLDKSKLYARYWSKPENRKRFFEKYASDMGFDPLQPENWHSLPKNSILSRKGVSMVIYHHNNQLSQALIELFPDIGLDKKQLFKSWSLPSRRKMFFQEYAEENGFNPLDSEAWYLQPKEELMSRKGAANIVSYHGGSLSRALLDLFPDINLDRSRLFKSYWSQEQTRKAFFIQFAKDNGMDPLVAENWNQVSRENVYAMKGGKEVLRYYSNSLSKALKHIFSF